MLINSIIFWHTSCKHLHTMNKKNKQNIFNRLLKDKAQDGILIASNFNVTELGGKKWLQIIVV